MSLEPSRPKHPGPPRLLSVETLLVFSGIRQYLSLNELAELTGVPRNTLCKSMLRLPASEHARWLAPCRTARIRKPMLNDATLPTLHALVDKGHTKQAIADRLRVNKSTIYRALRRPLPASAGAMALQA